ncbi:hypothetical protein N7U49_46210 [Streptomyces sp. AD2-2]|nr:hypothetical protein N7U49_46210 [Streptomyces sp. AD2-2]
MTLVNRNGPSSSTLHQSTADGSNERFLPRSSAYDYHAAFYADSATVYFTVKFAGRR